jgi:hypothetical protein
MVDRVLEENGESPPGIAAIEECHDAEPIA